MHMYISTPTSIDDRGIVPTTGPRAHSQNLTTLAYAIAYSSPHIAMHGFAIYNRAPRRVKLHSCAIDPEIQIMAGRRAKILHLQFNALTQPTHTKDAYAKGDHVLLNIRRSLAIIECGIFGRLSIGCFGVFRRHIIRQINDIPAAVPEFLLL